MIGRRDLLKGAGTALIGLLPARSLAATRVVPSYTVLRDINAETPPEVLRVVLEAFKRQGLPATCLVTLDAPGAGRLGPDNPVIDILTEVAGAVPGLVEIAPHIHELATLSSYFQARQAAEMVARLKSLLGDAAAATPIRSIACDTPQRPQSPQGLRGAGLHTVLLLPEESGPLRSERWPDGTVRFLGGRALTLDDARRAYWEIDTERSQVLWTISMAQLVGDAPAQLSAKAAVFASQALAAEAVRGLAHLTLSEAQLRDDYGYGRDLLLHLVTRNEDSPAFQTLSEDLAARGIAHSYSLVLEGVGFADGIRLKLIPGKDPGKAGRGMRLAETSAGPAQSVILQPRPGAFRGLSAENALVLPSHLLADPDTIYALEQEAEEIEDKVLLVDADRVRSGVLKTALLRGLEQMLARPGRRAVALPTALERLLPQSPYIGHHRRTERFREGAVQPVEAVSPAERAALMEDARCAWRYFSTWTNPVTGLCPATVYNGKGGRRLHEAVTMWDVGSHINALIAAHDLGLIADAEFQARSARIMPQIVGRRYNGRLLPQGWIRTDRPRWGTRDFDACDAGRLLAALYALENHPAAKARPSDIVHAYDLDAVIHAGEIQNVTDGMFHSSYRSHCAHYAAHAFRIWGFDARSPYEVMRGRSSSDGQMALIEASGLIGPLGAEPLLLEAVELGMSPESVYLADLLFAAQLEEYEETGRLKCVSECPIDREPWFLYSGLQLDAEGRRWATDTVNGHARHRSQAFADANAVISSKAAYLWAAWRPHPYTERVLDHVRARARQQVGFSPGIYEADDRAMPNYSDLNTNAIILQAIAYRVTNANV
ncbi:hypothetical protein FHS00_003413 [Limimaricola variabilis]|uniref:DUF3131 domain-containing protein n=1 Tax=Limimaricola variabilis TaxID=1492771 RepID=A0ABR6HTB8_9RHOB|nr:hypothetical protein [Limimaricola variabilis]